MDHWKCQTPSVKISRERMCTWPAVRVSMNNSLLSFILFINFPFIGKLWEILPTSTSDNVYTSLAFNGNDIALFVVGPEWMRTESGSSKNVWAHSTTLTTITHKEMHPYIKKVQQKVTHDLFQMNLQFLESGPFFFSSTAIKRSFLCCSKTVIVTCRQGIHFQN